MIPRNKADVSLRLIDRLLKVQFTLAIYQVAGLPPKLTCYNLKVCLRLSKIVDKSIPHLTENVDCLICDYVVASLSDLEIIDVSKEVV